MFQSAIYQNFKSLANVRLSFERLTVVVGPNGSGKTSVLQGLDLLSKLCLKNAQDVFADQRELGSLFRRHADSPLILTGCAPGDSSLRFRATPPGSKNDQNPLLQVIQEKFNSWQLDVHMRSGRQSSWQLATTSQLKPDFGSTAFLRLNPARMVGSSYSDLAIPNLQSDGSGLASVLAYLALTHPELFRDLQDEFRRLIPGAIRVRFERVPVTRVESESIAVDGDRLTRQVRKEYIGESIVFDFVGAENIAASFASEGTVVALGLITALLGPNRPNVVLLDDIEQGLHPLAQEKLVMFLRKILECDPNLQIIATTHSPFVLDCLRPEEVRVAYQREDGVTACASLQDNPDFENWKAEMKPGEMWSMFGESWVGNRAAGNSG